MKQNKQHGKISIQLILLVFFGGGAGLFMGKLMYDMVNYMGVMTASVQVMGSNMTMMSNDMKTMREEFVSMSADVKEMRYILKELNTNIIDMNAGVMDMDYNMVKMETGISQIQKDMSDDMHGIRLSVDYMAGNVGGMNRQMGTMVHDIHRGQSSFTSPMGYMNNLMRPE